MGAAPATSQTRKQKGPRPKHVPQRMCVACRAKTAKRGLTRIVRTPEGKVLIDPTGKRNGRGAYICHQRACWNRALNTGSLDKALNITIGEVDRDALRAFADALPPETPDRAAGAQEGTITG